VEWKVRVRVENKIDPPPKEGVLHVLAPRLYIHTSWLHTHGSGRAGWVAGGPSCSSLRE